MQAHFEIDQSAYPVGYLKSGDGYKVTNMLNLQSLHPQPISIDEAKRICTDVNSRYRGGKLSEQSFETFVQAAIK